MRGLKLNAALGGIDTRGSHPLRVRGLKLSSIPRYSGISIVAPPAGAWIETASPDLSSPKQAAVAPPAGAWIETKRDREQPGLYLGRTPCGCVD